MQQRKSEMAAWLLGAMVLSGCPVSSQAAGDRTFHNDEFGMRVTFPAGGKVCPALSGDHAHGFYAWYHAQSTLCGSTHVDPAASSLSLYASYNSAFWKTPWEELQPSCQTAKPMAAQRNLSFKGYRSVSCISRKADGVIEVDVVAFTGRWKGADTSSDPDLQTPYLSYRASLTTTSGRFERDMVLFRIFLAKIDIRPPQ